MTCTVLTLKVSVFDAVQECLRQLQDRDARLYPFISYWNMVCHAIRPWLWWAVGTNDCNVLVWVLIFLVGPKLSMENRCTTLSLWAIMPCIFSISPAAYAAFWIEFPIDMQKPMYQKRWRKILSGMHGQPLELLQYVNNFCGDRLKLTCLFQVWIDNLYKHLELWAVGHLKQSDLVGSSRLTGYGK